MKQCLLDLQMIAIKHDHNPRLGFVPRTQPTQSAIAIQVSLHLLAIEG